MTNEIAIVDIETTNFLNKNGLIVEIGIVILNLDTGKTECIYDELVKEDSFNEEHETSWIFNNSDLKHKDVMKASPLDTETIQEILDKYPATAYNKKFDFDFLRSRGLKIKELDCPMLIATPICKIPHPIEDKFKWPSVQEAWDFFFPDSGYSEKHRGADDAKHEAKIIHELYRLGKFKYE